MPNESTAKNAIGMRETLEGMPPDEIGTLAFNLSAIAWIALNLAFNGPVPHYMPCSYLHPNIINILGGALLVYSVYLATTAIKKGSLFPALIAFTFLWSLVSTIVRQFQN